MTSKKTPEKPAESKWTQEEMARRFRDILGDDDDQSREARKRRRILRAAHALFLAKGYRKTSIDEVARKAEVAKGTVYLYYASKGALLEAAVTLEKKTLMAQVAPLFDGSIPRAERLRHWLLMALTCARELPLSARLMTGDTELWAALEDIGSEHLAMRLSEGRGFLVELIEDAAPGALTDREKSLRADVLIGLGFFSGMLLDERARAGRSLDEYAATLADMLVGGIASRSEGGA